MNKKCLQVTRGILNCCTIEKEESCQINKHNCNEKKTLISSETATDAYRGALYVILKEIYTNTITREISCTLGQHLLYLHRE